MSNKLSFVFFLAVISAFGINTLEAQSKSEKKVTIVKKVIDKDGKETIERIEVSGDEADKYLEEMKSEKMSGEKINIDINIEEDGNNKTHVSTKKYKIKILGEDGKEKEMEWEGEGEMPEEMKKLIKEHDILIDQDVQGEGNKVVKMKFIDEDGEEHELESHGIKINRKEIVNKDGSTSIEINVDTEDMDKHEGLSRTVEVEVTDANREEEEIIVEVIEENTNKAQLGIMIENAPDGVAIIGFAPDSNAKDGGLKEGDVISNFNGTNVRTLEELVSAVGKYKAGDKVVVKFRRNNVTEEREIVLSPRTGSVKKKYKWKEAGQQ